MLECCGCKAVFDYPAFIRDQVGEYWGFPAYEDIACCPECGNINIGDYEEYEGEDDEDEYVQ